MADTTKGLQGLTFESAIAPNPGLANRLNDLRETGDPRFSAYDNEPERRFRRTMREIDEEGELLSQMLNWRPSRNERVQGQRQFYLGSNPSEDIGLEAAAAGFGESRFDRRMTSPAQLDDLEDARAREQSTLGVFGNSFAKMGVLAATTAADSWVGIPAGLINLAVEGFSGNIDSGKDFLNALVENPVSSYLQGINEKSEEVFRNYQTAEERKRPWWENMFTANFIGDTLIKNAGFTIGAVIGASGAVGAIGRLSGASEARDAFKGLAAELGHAGKTPSEVLEALAKGSTSLEKKAAVKALEESARRLKNAELGLQIAGGLIAGTGEARIEALNGASELEKQYEDVYGNIDLERAKALNRVRELMAQQGIDYNTREGRAYYEEQKAIIDENFIALREQIAHDKAMAANTIFALNVPLLTFGDVVQWGKLMLGGYAIDRKLVKGIKKATESAALRGAKKTPAELIEATRYAAKGTKFTDVLGKVKAGSRNVLVEMQEEMNQSLFSATAKAKAMGSTTEFMERLYDPNAVYDTVSWLDAAKEGMRQSWLNKDDWVEGFAGGFMGFMGLPSISVKVNEDGKRKPKITMEGGIWTPIREQNDLYKRRNELVKSLNNRLASKNFLNYYYGKIGNAHFDSIKESAVKSGDENLYKKADHAQLINDAIMFERAGRLQDFIDIIDSFGNVSDSTIEEIKKLFPGSDDVQSMTVSGMRTLISDNIERMKRQLDSYLKISDNIRTTYGNMIDDDTVSEMTWQTAHLDEIEHDLKDILSHPETSSMISAYKSENADSTKDLTDYQIVSSGAYSRWLVEKYKNKKDPTSKADLEVAIRDANNAEYDMGERNSYIENLSRLSSDPELIQKNRIRIQRQVEALRQLRKSIVADQILQTSDNLSEYINAVEDIDDGNIPEDALKRLKKLADEGNVLAKEFLIVHDMDAVMEETIRRTGEKSGATQDEINQAIAAWNYFKHNSNTAFDLVQKHTKDEIAPDVAEEKALNLLNESVSAIVKTKDSYKNIAKRTLKKEKARKEQGPESAPEGSTKFNTTGKKLTKAWFDKIVADIQKNDENDNEFGASLQRIDLEKADITFDGIPASGYIYLYYPGNKRGTGKVGGYVTPIAFDAYGNEIEKEDIEKLRGRDGMGLTQWISDVNFPMAGQRRFSILTDGLVKKAREAFPVDVKPEKKPVQSPVKEGGNKPGSKTNPHKFIAPNMDMALLGGDSHAVAELLKNLPNDAELRFGIESEDGPIYILAGDSNMKIGALPRQEDGSDVYSGLAELEALIRKEYAESKSRTNADGMWISEKYVNHMRDKRDTGFETKEGNVPINDIPGFDGIKKPIIMLVTGEVGKQKFLFTSDDVTVRDLQTRGSLTSGFAYLLVPSGKKYIPVLLFTQNVAAKDADGKSALDLNDPEVTSKGFGKRVSDTIDKVVDAISKRDPDKFRMWALNTKDNSSNDSLQRLLYFDTSGKIRVEFFIKETCKSHPAWFDNDDTLMVINVHNEETGEDDWTPIVRGKEKSDGTEYSLREQIIDTIFGLEYETQSGEKHKGPLAQVHPSHFANKEDAQKRMSELMESRMFLTDVKGFDMSMPSFLMDYWSVSQGKFLRPSSQPVERNNPVKAKVTQKKTKSGNQKIVTLNIGGKEVKYNLSTNEISIGSGKSFTMLSVTKANRDAAKKLGYDDFSKFFKTMRALAVIADKYGDKTTGENRIGDRVLLKGFSSGKDAGFILDDDGGRFMTSSELAKFKKDLDDSKKTKKSSKKEREAARVREVKKQEKKKEEKDDDDDDNEVEQVADTDNRVRSEEISRLETIGNVRQAIEHLKKYAPQYSEFLDYISNVRFYDDILVQLADNLGGKSVGKNKFSFRSKTGEYTDRIIIGRNSLGYQTMMHELVHAFTVVALKYDHELYGNVKDLMEYFKDNIRGNKLGSDVSYAFKNPYEFIAEFFSNPKLQELAKKVSAPKEKENEKPVSIFAKIVNFIADAFRSLFRKEKHDNFYEKLRETLYSVVDRQIELQESGKMVFKTGEDFEASKNLASGAAVTGVAFATKIPTVEQDYDYRFEENLFGDSELVQSPGQFNGPGKYLTLSQLVAANDEYSSLAGMKRFVNSKSLYEYNSGGESSIFGVHDEHSGVFVVVRALPAGSADYASLVKTASESEVPMIIGSTPDNVAFYESFGFHRVHDSSVEGKVFMANRAFTDEHLYAIGTTYRPFADVLDDSARFTSLRRESYTDEEWSKMSELEKYHARKCIGI